MLNRKIILAPVFVSAATALTLGSASAQQGGAAAVSTFSPKLEIFFDRLGLPKASTPGLVPQTAAAPAPAGGQPVASGSTVLNLTKQDAQLSADASLIRHGGALPDLDAATTASPVGDAAHMFCYMTCKPALPVPYCGTAAPGANPPPCAMVSDNDFLRSVAGRPSGVGRSPFVDGDAPPPAGLAPAPAGYTFLGQFIDHDLTRTVVDLGRDNQLAADASGISQRMKAAGFTEAQVRDVVPDIVRVSLERAAAPAPAAAPPAPAPVPGTTSDSSGFLDLDSMYGVNGFSQLKDAAPASGPVAGKIYANKYPGDFERLGNGDFTGRFAFQHITSPSGGESPETAIDGFDFVRNAMGLPVIPDPRNNENRVLGQLQSLFMVAHNDCMDKLTLPIPARFDQCQQLVRWTYQTIVVTDYLPRVLDPNTLDLIAHTGGPAGTATLPPNPAAITLSLYSCQPGNRQSAKVGIPLEFGVAAFRLGHSQVRQNYRLHNEVFNPQGELLAGEVRPIFSAPGGVSSATGISSIGLEASTPLPPRDVIDWSFFFNLKGEAEQLGRPLDAAIVARLFEMPVQALPPGHDPITQKDTPNERNLPRRNLLRAAGPNPRIPGAVGLATGTEALARLKEAIPGFTGQEDGITKLLSAKLQSQSFSPDDFQGRIPLWLWILAEAELGQRSQLGGLGTHIVGEFILGSLKCDQESVVNRPAAWPAPAAQWQPTRDIQARQRYSMPELISYLQASFIYDKKPVLFSSR